ncbi:MAG TPA: hypothetical protein PKY29_06795, partial [Ferruginibacter sp.]|nr:hypothetical protein [Ferruginibacter sp.]HRO17432.1 hypothetical protein [Ferruginibacter sp.]HRQ21005.1 hypothetical protein [Ferruginibacter sp.]
YFILASLIFLRKVGQAKGQEKHFFSAECHKKLRKVGRNSFEPFREYLRKHPRVQWEKDIAGASM